MLPDLDYSCGAAFCDDPACNVHGAKDRDDRLLYWTPQRRMCKLAEMRPTNYDQLSPQEQWDVDKRLGILDWDGE